MFMFGVVAHISHPNVYHLCSYRRLCLRPIFDCLRIPRLPSQKSSVDGTQGDFVCVVVWCIGSWYRVPTVLISQRRWYTTMLPVANVSACPRRTIRWTSCAVAIPAAACVDGPLDRNGSIAPADVGVDGAAVIPVFQFGRVGGVGKDGPGGAGEAEQQQQ